MTAKTLTQKSILARLLANENIEVIQGNYPTAFFDVEKRVLGLPFFNADISKDLYDLLVGHEVGHALFTPADGWHDSETEVPNAPRALINIVEDIRIEKLILRQYPGLFAGFKRGYQDLLDRNFFGIEGKDLNEMNLLDRLNLASKSRGLVDVEFADEEKAIVAQAMAVETWDDVLKACAAIADFMGLEKPEQKESEEETSISVSSSGSDENEAEEEQEQEGSGSSDEESDDEQNNESDSGEESKEEGDDEQQSSNVSGSGPAEEKEEEAKPKESANAGGNSAGRSNQEKTIISETDEAFRNNEKTLVDNVSAGGNNIYVKGMSRAMFEQIKVSYKTVEDHRIKMGSYNNILTPEGAYDTWMKDAKGQVNLLVKEFEMRKAAYRTMRARTSNKGSLDVTKLHKYRYDDQLFKQVTNLADAKSHGMVMIVDWSGSMYRQIESVMRQTAIMCMFCKRVGIPFEVYGFTNSSGEQYRDAILADKKENAHTKILTGDMQIVEVLTSSMPKKAFDTQIKFMFNMWRHMYYGQNSYDNMRGTPLYESLMGVHYILEDFRKKHIVQKLNLIVLTDGDGDRVDVMSGTDMLPLAGANNGWFDPIRGKKQFLDFRGKQLPVKIEQSYREKSNLQEVLLENIKKEFGATVCHYFIAESARSYKAEILRATNCTWIEAQSIATASRKQGAFIVDNQQGYDRRFILEARGDILSRAKTDDLAVNTSMTAGQITTAFKKTSNGRSKKRFFSQKFAEMIA